MNDDPKARGALQKAQELKAKKDYVSAIEVLLSLPGGSFNPTYTQCLDLLVELCLCYGAGKYVQRLDLARARSRLRGSQQLEEGASKLVDIIIRHFSMMCQISETTMASIIEKNSEDDVIMAEISCVSIQQRVHKQYQLPCQRAAEQLAKELFRNGAIGTSKKVFGLFCETAIKFTNLCHAHKLTKSIEITSSLIASTFQNLITKTHSSALTSYERSIQADRKDFFKSETSGGEVVRVLCHLLDLLTQKCSWTQTWFVLNCLKQVSDELYDKKGAKDLKMIAYKKMADVFWECRLYNYHAHCLAIAAAQEEDGHRTLATRAVLAVLAGESQVEEENPFSARNENPVHPDVVETFENPNITKAALLARLKLDNVLASADLDALFLVKAVEGTEQLNNASIEFRTLYKKLSGLIQRDPSSLQMYEKRIQLNLLYLQMGLLSENHNRVQVQLSFVFNSEGKDITDLEYVNVVEPAILKNNAVPVEIDSKSKTIYFRNSTMSKLLRAFTTIASEVDPETPLKTNPTSLSSIGVEELLAAQRHSQYLNSLQMACCKGVHARSKERLNKLEQARQKKIEDRKEQEEIKRANAMKIKTSKLYAEYRERQRQERSKLVVAKLRVKYPGFKVDSAICMKSSGAFEDELTQILAAFKRKNSESDRKEALMMNLYEKALRQLEIPKLKEQQASNAEQLRAEAEAAKTNILMQHRKEFERRQEEKMVLKKFLPDEEAFKDQWLRHSTQGKVSKWDEQQNLLEQEMQRLAAQQGE
ncbi:unnamed protein product [Phytomonas sp. Hart1]|nr:unnamed protein product [Phytomonas sp. Hart1]|eukprot:CCW70826.1 unnamed protein product [Phytomonas sp. isolate Hart1]